MTALSLRTFESTQRVFSSQAFPFSVTSILSQLLFHSREQANSSGAKVAASIPRLELISPVKLRLLSCLYVCFVLLSFDFLQLPCANLLLTNSPNYSSTHSFIHPLVHPPTRSSIHSFIYPLIHPPTHSYTHSFIHPLIHTPTHSSTHAFTHARRQYKAVLQVCDCQNVTLTNSWKGLKIRNDGWRKEKVEANKRKGKKFKSKTIPPILGFLRIWFWFLFCFVLFCIVLYCFVLDCFILFCMVLYGFVWFCMVLYGFVLFCIVLYCFVLFCIVLYCFIRNVNDIQHSDFIFQQKKKPSFMLTYISFLLHQHRYIPVLSETRCFEGNF